MKSVTIELEDREKQLLNRLQMTIAIKDEMHSGFPDVRLWDWEWNNLVHAIYGKLAMKGAKDKEELSKLKDKINKSLEKA